MTTKQTPEPDIASTEAEALRLQALEAQAEERFDAARTELASAGRADDVTSAPELRQWLEARARTDEAWGRWAMAMDAAAETAEQ